MQAWTCGVCGYTHKKEGPPQRCPVCGADKLRFSSSEGKDQPPPEIKPTKESAPLSEQAVRQWRCLVCGYVHKGIEPPERCPVCGAPKSKFVLVEEDAPVQEMDRKTTESEPGLSRQEAEGPGLSEQEPSKTILKFEPFLKTLSKLHAHPISVHIPNGVLPLTVLFTFLAYLFDSEDLALAARYNLIFICLSMPVVIATGLIDWRIRFEQRMSQVFGVKMVCAGIVLLLSLTLAIWWIVQPEIHSGEAENNGLFLFLNIADLTAAAIAGWYGGKLVFPDSSK